MARRRRKKLKLFKWVPGFVEFVTAGVIRILPIAILTGALFGLGLGVKQVLFADPGLLIKSIEVVPQRALNARQLSSLEKKYLNKNIMGVDLKRISRDVKRDPEVLKVQVLKVLPNRLQIEVEKRAPMALVWSPSQKRFGVIAQDGMILDLTDREVASFVRLDIAGQKVGRLRVGNKLKITGLTQTIEFFRKFNDHPLSLEEKVDHMGIGENGEVFLVLQNGPKVKLGRYPLESFKSLDKIEPIIKGKERSKIAYIDLSFDQVVVKKKS